ncbi:MAG: 3'(2'),5'-bisphosphate nucleotidase CysQ [Alphaproteobacteria bacterium]
MTDDALAQAIRQAALEAGNHIMRIYATDFDVATKDDASPVTDADEGAEKIILAALEKLTPEIPIVAEERAAAGHIPDIGDGPFWLVDPLDGTREFINRNGDFTVNIALIRDGRPALGTVYAPARDLMFVAAGPGQVTREVEGGAACQIACRATPADGAVVVASRSHLSPETEDWLKTQKVQSMSPAGSSLKFCLVATGEADLYPRHGRTMEWDTAAGHAVLAAAGGSVRRTDGNDLTYGKSGFENPHFIARGLD